MTAEEKNMLNTHYSKEHFPTFVINDGPWDIYKDEHDYCAAIPVDLNSGYVASHYGTMDYVRKMFPSLKE